MDILAWKIIIKYMQQGKNKKTKLKMIKLAYWKDLFNCCKASLGGSYIFIYLFIYMIW